MRAHYRKRRYSPSLYKNFRTALEQFIKEEFPRFGGSRIRKMFVKEIEGMIERFYPRFERVGGGYLPWFGVAKEDRPARGKTMADTKLRLAILPFITSEDITNLNNNMSQREVRERRIVRVLISADKQDVTLSGVDLSLMFGVSTDTISKVIVNYEREHNISLPRRGTIHDLGPTMSHKALICRKKLIEGKETPDIAKETFHSPSSVDRYLLSFNRVQFCIRKKMNDNEIAFATQMSPSLIRQYRNLYKEIYEERKTNSTHGDSHD